ncbi:MAG: CpsD/CapB family tyrosine-protein kinase [Aristaeellaceae bacterium]
MIAMDIQRFPEPDYAVANAVNTLCTNLSFADGARKIMLTSCHPQEGKSYISMHLMRAMAMSMGLRTVLVDADIRASSLRGRFSIKVLAPQPYTGLTGYLSGRCEMEDIVGQTNIPGADLILSGKTVMNSLPLYNSTRMEVLLDQLGRAYDMVIVDAPPVGTIVDAARLAALCDATLFVVASGSVRAGKLKEAVSQIERTGCPIVGYVLNKSRTRSKEDRYYYYGKQTKHT